MEELNKNMYSARFVFPEGRITGVAIIAASSVYEADLLLKRESALKDYSIHIEEMVQLPGSTYCGESVLIKEYLSPEIS